MNKYININAFNKCAGDENGIVNRKWKIYNTKIESIKYVWHKCHDNMWNKL